MKNGRVAKLHVFAIKILDTFGDAFIYFLVVEKR
jgi:hypothetical protein